LKISLWIPTGCGAASAGRFVVDAIDKARDKGLSRINVMANEHALVFYKNVGFVYDGTSRLRFGTGHRMHIDVPSRPERGRLK
jgi:hypothetical protein